ncbi:hypothetical protein HMPREF1589_02692 [Escherichia coli 113290]|nr:hypothetical protein HMPREF1589_02692 [Escherichia coli 113290]
MRAGHLIASLGLSPLARGTRDTKTATDIINRFIPASAGNSTLSVKKMLRRSVYPR